MLDFKQNIFEKLLNGLLGHRAIVVYDFVLLIALLTLLNDHFKSPMLPVLDYHQLSAAAIVAACKVPVYQVPRVLKVFDAFSHDGRADVDLDDLDVAEAEVAHHGIYHCLIGLLWRRGVTQHQGDLLEGYEEVPQPVLVPLQLGEHCVVVKVYDSLQNDLLTPVHWVHYLFRDGGHLYLLDFRQPQNRDGWVLRGIKFEAFI